MDIRHHIHLLWRWSWAIVLAALLAGAAAYTLSNRIPPVYEASVRLLVYQAPASSGTSDYTEILTSSRMVRSYAEAMQARPILQDVTESLGLPISAATLAEQLDVQVLRETQVMVVTVSSAEPEQAVAIANELARLFVQQHDTLTAALYADSKQNLEDELSLIQDDIDAAQQSLMGLGNVRTFLEQAEYDRTQMLLWQLQSRYSLVFHSLENVRMAEAQSTDLIHIIEPAILPTEPVGSSTILLTLLAAMSSAFLVIVAVTLKDYLDTRVRTPEQIEEITHQPVLAAVPRRHMLTRQHRRLASEAYATLAARLGMLRQQQPFTTLLVTSSLPREGTSTVATHLADVLAQTGQRVLLVDANLRRPTLHEHYQTTSDSGFPSVLEEGLDGLNAAIQPTENENLSLLPAGEVSECVLQLLKSPYPGDLIALLKTRADIVLFDSAALLPVVDTQLLARHIDAALLVVRAAATTPHTLQQAHTHLHQADISLLGTVLNAAPARRDTASRYQRYYQRQQHRVRQTGDAHAFSDQRAALQDVPSPHTHDTDEHRFASDIKAP